MENGINNRYRLLFQILNNFFLSLFFLIYRFNDFNFALSLIKWNAKMWLISKFANIIIKKLKDLNVADPYEILFSKCV